MSELPGQNHLTVRRRILEFMAVVPLLVAGCLAQDHVILLHGMCRSKRSMASLEAGLTRAGYRVWNVDYPSRSAEIDPLSEEVVGPAVGKCQEERAATIHFVTHSLGGILVRSYLARHTVPGLGRVVMLGPPNQGSEVVDRLGRLWLFRVINGPAGSQLGTAPDSVPNQLGPVRFCVGVIAGNRSINWINSCWIVGPDDGKVSVERTKVAGMTDHIVLPATHPMMMRKPMVIRQVIHFLRAGAFERADAGKPSKAAL